VVINDLFDLARRQRLCLTTLSMHVDRVRAFDERLGIPLDGARCVEIGG